MTRLRLARNSSLKRCIFEEKMLSRGNHVKDDFQDEFREACSNKRTPSSSSSSGRTPGNRARGQPGAAPRGKNELASASSQDSSSQASSQRTGDANASSSSINSSKNSSSSSGDARTRESRTASSKSSSGGASSTAQADDQRHNRRDRPRPRTHDDVEELEPSSAYSPSSDENEEEDQGGGSSPSSGDSGSNAGDALDPGDADEAMSSDEEEGVRERRGDQAAVVQNDGAAGPPGAAAVPAQDGGGGNNGAAQRAAPAAPAARNGVPPGQDPNQHSTAQMFGDFPHESAIVMRRGIELGVICSYVLVAHCIVITIQYWDSEVEMDTLLRALAILRIICAMPRPYYWFHTRAQFVESRYQPTPQLVTRRLLQIYNKQSIVEKVFFAFYYAWLLGVAIITLLVPTTPAVGYSAALWRHCVLNMISLIVHRLLCVSLFYYVMHSDLMRGIPKDIVDKYTTKYYWEEHMRLTDPFMMWSSSTTKKSSSKSSARTGSKASILTSKSSSKESATSSKSSSKESSTASTSSQRSGRGKNKAKNTDAAEDENMVCSPAPLENRAESKESTASNTADDDEADCAICYGPYSRGDHIRRLKCGHTFHVACVDTWLLGHQNKCPLCGFVVGPHFLDDEEEEEDDT
ncbi:unnamed protein product [Amoebophrya sp. A25]|nr:unnamed protein product [Amoebophrya sp. A25]|eukprot:GSA25T00010373001.1